MAKNETKPKGKRKFSAREDRLYGQEKIYSRDDAFKIRKIVFDIHMAMSMCECADHVPNHQRCRQLMKIHLRRIQKALGS